MSFPHFAPLNAGYDGGSAIAVIAMTVVVAVVMRNSQHALNSAHDATGHASDHTTNHSADRTGRALPHGGAVRASAHNALGLCCERRTKNGEHDDGYWELRFHEQTPRCFCLSDRQQHQPTTEQIEDSKLAFAQADHGEFRDRLGERSNRGKVRLMKLRHNGRPLLRDRFPTGSGLWPARLAGFSLIHCRFS